MDTYVYNRKGCKKRLFHSNHFYVFGECMERLWAAKPNSKPKFDWLIVCVSKSHFFYSFATPNRGGDRSIKLMFKGYTSRKTP